MVDFRKPGHIYTHMYSNTHTFTCLHTYIRKRILKQSKTFMPPKETRIAPI